MDVIWILGVAVQFIGTVVVVSALWSHGRRDGSPA